MPTFTTETTMSHPSTPTDRHRDELRDILARRSALPVCDPDRAALAWEAVIGVQNIVGAAVGAVTQQIHEFRPDLTRADMMSSINVYLVEKVVDRYDPEKGQWHSFATANARRYVYDVLDEHGPAARAGLSDNARTVLRATMRHLAGVASPTATQLLAAADAAVADERAAVLTRRPDLDVAGVNRALSQNGWTAARTNIVEHWCAYDQARRGRSFDSGPMSHEPPVGPALLSAPAQPADEFTVLIQQLLSCTMPTEAADVLDAVASGREDSFSVDDRDLSVTAVVAGRVGRDGAEIVARRVNGAKAVTRSHVQSPHVQWAHLAPALERQLEGSWS
jgi:hypothetical protein